MAVRLYFALRRTKKSRKRGEVKGNPGKLLRACGIEGYWLRNISSFFRFCLFRVKPRRSVTDRRINFQRQFSALTEPRAPGTLNRRRAKSESRPTEVKNPKKFFESVQKLHGFRGIIDKKSRYCLEKSGEEDE